MRYEYKKLFSSKLMWFMLLLTLGYMVFLPLREVWANIENNRDLIKAYQASAADVEQNDLTIDDLTEMQNEIYQNGLGENSGNYKARYGKNALGDLYAISKTIDLMSAFYEKHLDGACDLTLKIFAPPASGENDLTLEDGLFNSYTTVEKMPKIRIRFAPVEP